MNIIQETTEVEVNIHTLVAKGFPVHLWKEWKKQCQEKHNDIYWVKIWTDHLKAQTYDNLVKK